MIFNPTLLMMTDSAKKSGQHYALYKSWEEYIICDFYERDEYLKRGYRDDPSEFLRCIADWGDQMSKLADKRELLSQEIDELEQKEPKVRKKRVARVKLEDEQSVEGVISAHEPMVDDETVI
jgi:hypothetical protein